MYTNHRFAVARYKSNGDLDTAFSTDGLVKTQFAGFTEATATAVAVDADGRYVVAGYVRTSGARRFALARYNADGTLDASFSGDGKQVTALADSGDCGAQAVAIDADGRIVAAGFGTKYGNKVFAVARYTANGQLDATFGGGAGSVLTGHVGLTGSSARAAVIEGSGRILTAGHAFVAGQNNYALAAYEPDGTLSPSFSDDGKTIGLDGGSPGEAWASDVAVDAAGRIVACGTSKRGGGPKRHILLVRLTPDGVWDPDFAVNGSTTLSIDPAYDDFAQAMAIDADGRIVAALHTEIGGAHKFGVGRFTADGEWDAAFGTDGRTLTAISGWAAATCLAINPANGKIVVGGSAALAPGAFSKFALARYSASGAADASFSGDGKLTTSFPGSSNAFLTGVAITGGGKIVAVGYACDWEAAPPG